jgi:hypothetical protein
MPEENLSSLERVRQRLYSNQAPAQEDLASLHEKKVEQPTGWDKLKSAQTSFHIEEHHMSGPARFFVAALVFFVLTASAAGAYLLYGGRSVSTNNVIVKTQGPTTIASGDTVPLLVTIDNKNPVALKDVTITITFPEGTRASDDPTKPLPNYTESLGDIQSGGHLERTIKAAVFGSEGQQIVLPITIQYKTDKSNSVFVKQTQYDVIVTTSPIALTISSLSQVSSGQSLTVDVLVKSNATTPLQNVAVSAEYPFGFALSATDPKPVTGSLFYIGTLAPGEQKRISISGVVSGENQDDRIFAFTGGTLSSPTSPTLATSYTRKEADIKLTKPFLTTTLTVNHDSTDNPVILSGVPVQATVTWINNLASQITNAQVQIALSGEALDMTSVIAGTGFYRSSDNTILFNYQTNQSLASLQPGDTGQGNFSFTTKKGSALTALRNPSISMKISIAGKRVSETNVPEVVTSTITRVIKIGTNLALSSRAVRTIGGISNTGPWPPVPNQETTYTVQYTLTNSVNSVAGATVVATLPPYVRYTAQVVPNDGTLTYDDTNHTVTWNAGDLPAGTQTPKTLSFQIALMPSLSQQGQVVPLLTDQKISGTDRFTGKVIQGTVNDITTQITADPAYTDIKGKVK